MLTGFRYRSLLITLIVLGSFALCGTAAASVAYIDANEVWVSSDDGAQKVRLSAGQGDWREVAQSDLGYIVGTRRTAGLISQTASFTVWNPSGQIVHFGSLSGAYTGGLNIYPNGIDITPSGGNIVYGFSASNSHSSSAGKGIYLKVSADATTAVPQAMYGGQYPTLVGTRNVAAVSSSIAGLQDPSSIGVDSFAPWINFPTTDAGHPLYNLVLTRTDVSATGTVTASEFRDDSFYTQKVNLGKWTSLGGTYIDDCMLPTAGLPSNVSVSQDGSTVTWRDDRGVVLAGVPDFSGPATCNLTRAPSVVSASGIYPSYGPFNVAAAAIAAPAVPKPKLSVSSSIKLNSLKSGVKVSVTSAVAGKAKLTLTIKPSKVGKKGKKLITLATGSANVAAGVKKKIKLKFTSAGKKLKKKLKGKKATLTLSVGGQKTAKTVKLK